MTHEQRSAILAHVRVGRTWSQAATLAGVHPEQLTLFVLAVKQGRRLDFTGFVRALEDAGKVATEQSLSTTRRGVEGA